MTVEQRIQDMETALNKGLLQEERLTQVLEELEKTMPEIQELFAYYGSKEWFRHLEMEADGKLSPHLPRGVLSEDGVYNLILSYREIAEQLRDLALKIDEAIDQ